MLFMSSAPNIQGENLFVQKPQVCLPSTAYMRVHMCNPELHLPEYQPATSCAHVFELMYILFCFYNYTYEV